MFNFMKATIKFAGTAAVIIGMMAFVAIVEDYHIEYLFILIGMIVALNACCGLYFRVEDMELQEEIRKCRMQQLSEHSVKKGA